MKNFTRMMLLAFVATSLTVPAIGQNDFSDQVSQPSAWSHFKLPNKRVKLDFKNASADAVLQYFSKVSGITIIKDPTLKDTLSLSTATSVSLADAFDVLNVALGLHKFELHQQGKMLVVQAKQQGGRGNFPGGDTGAFTMPSQPKMVLRVYQLKNALASSVAKTLNDVYQQNTSGGGAVFQFGGPGGPGGPGGFRNRMQQFAQGNQNNGPTVRASSDDYSNSVIVNAASTDQVQVAELVDKLDKPVDDAVVAKVYALQFASSDDLVTVVNNLLTANAPKGRGGAASTNGQQGFGGGGGGGFFGRLFGGGGNNQNAQAVSEPRTNSLIVTTTPQNQDLVAKVLKDVDKEVDYQPATFVIPLNNAKADDMATLLQQAFGRRTGVTNTTTGSTSNTTNRITGTSGSRSTNGTTGTGGTTNRLGGNNVTPGSDLPIALADPSKGFGALETNIAIDDALQAQFFGGAQQNRGTSSQTGSQTTPQKGFGPNGQIINLQDLTNQVTIVPDTNTNTIILVGSPAQAALVEKIIAQLDKIPQQVMIETIIVEASLGAEDKLGVDWSNVLNKFGGDPKATGSVGQNFGVKAAAGNGFQYSLAGGGLSAYINALKTDTQFKVLSSPRIFTSNNVQAQINISQQIPYVTSTSTNTNGVSVFNYAFENVGIVLTVTPRITANGYVSMDIDQTANDLQGFTSFNAPIVNQREANTIVAVKDGESIILGGIIRSQVTSTVNKIPILGDIPILGKLFQSSDVSKTRDELLVFLTPRIVKNPDDAAKLKDEQMKQLSKETQGGAKRAVEDSQGKGGTTPPPALPKADPPKTDPGKGGGN